LNYYHSQTDTKPIFVGAGLNIDFKLALAKYNTTNAAAVKNSVKPYIIFVGTIEPRKNIPFLLTVFKKLSNQFDLIILGGKGWGNAENKISSILNAEDYPKNNVRVISNIDTDHLIALYKNAALYLTTSFNEGLGLPLLEAMACGCPVVCSHNSAMIEVVQGVGITVNSWDVNDWLNAISEVKSNREYYVDRGYKRVDNFNWEKVITSFVKLLNS